MFIEITAAILIGILFGVFTGIVPGVHVNLIALLVASFSVTLLGLVSPITLGVFIIALAITHTFLDSIPSIYLGAPDAAQSLNALPGHRLLLKGLGHQAVTYTVIGSIGTLILGLLFFPFFIKAMLFIEPYAQNYVGYALILIMSFMILREKRSKKVWALVLFLISGALGLIVLNFPNMKQPLFPLLSGLFGFSILLTSLFEKTKIPKQKTKTPLTLSKKNLTKATTAATSVGFIAAFLPGFGSAQAAIIATQIVGKIGDEGFLTLVGGINTANMLISIATAYALSKARNGAIVVVNQILGGVSFTAMLTFIFTALVAGSIAAILTLSISKIFGKYITKVPYAKVVISILSFITLLTFYFDGFVGLIVLATSTAIGLLATNAKVGKNHLMGCLIVPVIMFFLL